ncbi:MAG TPA: M20/M25/M40 family metallo-hydrolase, partial [Pyrinomonadaceae bacterium]
MKKLSTGFLLLVFIFVHAAPAQERLDEQALARIKAEGFQNSKIMETLSYVTDVFGGRLTNSPNLKNAQNWTRDRMISWGFENVGLESWGNWGKGWSVDKFSVEMFEPTYDRLNAYPLAWTPSTSGAVSGNPLVVSIRSNADFAKYRGKLKGAVVLNGRFDLNSPESRFQTPSRRFTDEELARASLVINPAKDGEINGGATTNYRDEEKDWQVGLARGKEITKFFKDEGVAALILPSSRANGVLSVQGYYETDSSKNVPTFVLAREQYARIVRLNDKNIAVRLELNLQARGHEDLAGYNVVGEIVGSDSRIKDEVVMLGGHFDSWHAGSGATDNAAGCVVMMEALRILKKIGAKPRRTIRVALWSGEEQDYGGSVGYVRKHFGDPL